MVHTGDDSADGRDDFRREEMFIGDPKGLCVYWEAYWKLYQGRSGLPEGAQAPN